MMSSIGNSNQIEIPKEQMEAWLEYRLRATKSLDLKRINRTTISEPLKLTERRPIKHRFRRFAQSQFNFPLDAWQIDLCDRLEDVFRSKGRRILIHVAPQMGKTVLVSQRFPAYCLGEQPDMRIKLAMYNITHAIKKGGRIVRDILQSKTFQRFYPSPSSMISNSASAEEFSTKSRLSFQDGQSSFKSLGLITGFVGEGADLLVMDDPYPSAKDASSDAYNHSLQHFWKNTASPRLEESSNVICMFHRYTPDDFAGWLLSEYPGEWELWFYPSLHEGNFHDEAGNRFIQALPLSRMPGDFLTNRRSPYWYKKQQEDAATWRSQHQGVPIVGKGEFFDTTRLETVAFIPDGLNRVRGWDFAATPDSLNSAATASVKIAGPDKEGIYYIEDVTEEHLATSARMRHIKAIATEDGESVTITIPGDPGSAGKDIAAFSIRHLAGFHVVTYKAKEDKILRAQPFADQVNAGNIRLLRAEWNATYRKRLKDFPFGKLKDVIDASSDAFSQITKENKPPNAKKRSSTSFSIYD